MCEEPSVILHYIISLNVHAYFSWTPVHQHVDGKTMDIVLCSCSYILIKIFVFLLRLKIHINMDLNIIDLCLCNTVSYVVG